MLRQLFAVGRFMVFAHHLRVISCECWSVRGNRYGYLKMGLLNVVSDVNDFYLHHSHGKCLKINHHYRMLDSALFHLPFAMCVYTYYRSLTYAKYINQSRCYHITLTRYNHRLWLSLHMARISI